MAATYAQHVSKKVTPQSQAIPGSNQVPNSAGGFSWKVDCWTRLHRFLILGSEKGCYYASEKKLTVENAVAVLECAKADIARTINTIVEISDGGRAPKNDAAIFALGLLIGEKGEIGNAALAAMSKVCRIGTHLFQCAATVDATRGWGRSVRRAFSDWYLSKEPDKLAYQVAKYQQRDGWSHRDILRLCHAPSNSALMRWIIGVGNEERSVKRGEAVKQYAAVEGLPAIVEAFEKAKVATTAAEVAGLIREHNLPRECVPTQWLNEKEVWAALLEQMPITAMVRNLGKLSSIGLLSPLSDASRLVSDRLGDVERLKKGRVHPIALLLAQCVYKQGHGDKGGLSWTPVPQVIDALDSAFYSAFAAVEPTGKRHLLALDVSGSMGGAYIAGTWLTAREGSAAMAMVTARTEPAYHFVGFSHELIELNITAKMRLDTVVNGISNIPFGRTDCAQPMIYALQRKMPVDVFIVYTDNETWCGGIHPAQALAEYRNEMGINAKLIVCGMVANEFSIASPEDAGMLDCCGFDASTPTAIMEFVKGFHDAEDSRAAAG